MGRGAEADALVSSFEREAGLGSASYLPPSPETIASHATSDLFRHPFLASLIVGCVSLMVANTLIQGFVVWLPTFFVGQGSSIARSTGFALLMALGGPIGSALGALAADHLGRKLTIVVVSCLAIVLSAAFVFFRNVGRGADHRLPPHYTDLHTRGGAFRRLRSGTVSDGVAAQGRRHLQRRRP